MEKYYELFLCYPEFKTKAITLSFDDGRVEDRKMVETLNRYGIKCTFNLNSGIIDGDNNMIDCIKNCGIKYARTTVSTYSFDLQKDNLRLNPCVAL